MLNFLRRCFRIWVENGYGTSETSGICGSNHVRDDVEIKLEDVPEMGYFSTDAPMPRGEVLVRSPSLFKGYWNNAELTKESMADGGWYRTGDIAEMDPVTKHVKIIDRRKNFLKLAQGEFVAPERPFTALHCSWSLIHSLPFQTLKKFFSNASQLSRYMSMVNRLSTISSP